MSKLWILASGAYTGGMVFVPVMADTKKDVGNYIKNNVEKFFFMFADLYYCGDYYGKIYKKLKNWYKDDNFHDKIDDANKKKEFISDIMAVLEKMSDEEVVDELWGYNKDCESSYVNINCTNVKNIVDLRKELIA